MSSFMAVLNELILGEYLDAKALLKDLAFPMPHIGLAVFAYEVGTPRPDVRLQNHRIS